jgi:pentatricopeptide repeat protein
MRAAILLVALQYPSVGCFFHTSQLVHLSRTSAKLKSEGHSGRAFIKNIKNASDEEVKVALRGLVHGGSTSRLSFNERDYNILISAAARLGDWRLSSKLLHHMEGRGGRPNVRHYTAAIGACRAEHQQGPALELFREMQIKAVEPNEITYSTLVGGGSGT